MPSLINRLIVKDLAAAFQGAEGLIILTYGGLTADENETLRDKLAEKGCELRLVRNALAQLVLKQRGHDVPARHRHLVCAVVALAPRIQIAHGSLLRPRSGLRPQLPYD